jgi:carbon storage regulator
MLKARGNPGSRADPETQAKPREDTMLALSRKIGERIRVGEDIVIEVRGIFNNRVVLAVSAPDEVVIDREEVDLRKRDLQRSDEQPESKRPVAEIPLPRRRQGLRKVVREIDPSYAHRALRFEKVASEV